MPNFKKHPVYYYIEYIKYFGIWKKNWLYYIKMLKKNITIFKESVQADDLGSSVYIVFILFVYYISHEVSFGQKGCAKYGENTKNWRIQFQIVSARFISKYFIFRNILFRTYSFYITNEFHESKLTLLRNFDKFRYLLYVCFRWFRYSSCWKQMKNSDSLSEITWHLFLQFSFSKHSAF